MICTVTTTATTTTTTRATKIRNTRASSWGSLFTSSLLVHAAILVLLGNKNYQQHRQGGGGNFVVAASCFLVENFTTTRKQTAAFQFQQKSPIKVPSSSSRAIRTAAASSSSLSLPLSSVFNTCLLAASDNESEDSSMTSSPVDLSVAQFSSCPSTSSEASPPPVIFLHGLLGSKRNFASLGKALSVQLQTKRDVFAVDLRNHGENHPDNWRESMSYEEMARDVLYFMNQYELEKVVLVGHSMGGKVAQALALLEPLRVAGLVVLDIAPVTYCSQQDATWKAVKDIVTSLDTLNLSAMQTKKEVDLALRPTVEDPALRAFVLTNIHVDNDNTSVSWKLNVPAICSQLDVLAGFPSFEAKKEYLGDVFFIHGGQSRFVRHAHLPTIGEYFPNHMLTTIRGAGHWVHAEAPEDTIALLKRYLDR